MAVSLAFQLALYLAISAAHHLAQALPIPADANNGLSSLSPTDTATSDPTASSATNTASTSISSERLGIYIAGAAGMAVGAALLFSTLRAMRPTLEAVTKDAAKPAAAPALDVPESKEEFDMLPAELDPERDNPPPFWPVFFGEDGITGITASRGGDLEKGEGWGYEPETETDAGVPPPTPLLIDKGKTRAPVNPPNPIPESDDVQMEAPVDEDGFQVFDPATATDVDPAAMRSSGGQQLGLGLETGGSSTLHAL
ncbi:hypothetical protein BC831DRAFT_462088 [Entophlyctis helioformis]|nr:hypothetical protein BC831DRAFT_462088 [Entophlyctis helioformis]